MLRPDEYREIQLSISTQNLRFFRVGVLGDGRCLLHAILFLLNDEYVKKSPSERNTMCSTFLEELSSSLTVDDWLRWSLDDSVINMILSTRKTLSANHSPDYLDKLFENVFTVDDLTNIKLDTRERTVELRQRLIPGITQKLFDMYKYKLVRCQDLGYQEVHYISARYKVNILMFDRDANLFHDTRVNPSFAQTIMLFNFGGGHWEPILLQSNDKFVRHIPTSIIEFL